MKNIYLFLLLTFGTLFSQNGKIVSKDLVDLSKTPIWSKIAVNDTLINEYKYLENINFYFIRACLNFIQ